MAVQGARPRRFPGWRVVLALAFGGFTLYGAGLYSFILFVTPLSNEFHWSRAATGGLVSAFWLTAPLALFAQPLIRRFGSRRLAVAGVVVEALSLMLLFTATQLWHMYLLRALAGFGKMLFAINVPVVVARWFSRRFGLAIAINYAGWAIGGFALAPLTDLLIRTVGWRAASGALGLGLLLLTLPVTWWALRTESAAAAGLPLDGIAPGASGDKDADADADAAQAADAPVEHAGSWAVTKSLLRHPAFLLIALCTMAYYLTYSGVLAHQAAIVESAGIGSRAASWILGSTAGWAAVGALLVGWLLDRLALATVTVLQLGMLGAGVACLLASTYAPLPWLLAGHAVLFGLAVGGSEPFWITILRRRVPLEGFQQAWGIVYFLELAFIVVAPFIAGHLYDVSGSYRTSLGFELALVVLPLGLALLLALRFGASRPFEVTGVQH